MKSIYLCAAALLLAAPMAFAGERLGPPAGNWNPGDTQGAEQGGPRGVARGGQNRNGGEREHGIFGQLVPEKWQKLREADANGAEPFANPAGNGPDHITPGLFSVYICGADGEGACGR